MRRFVLPLLAMALAGCSGSAADPSTSPSPTTLAITGTITVPGGNTDRGLEGGTGQTCTMDGGYSDIRTGAQVVVSEARGSTIALGALGPGVLDLPDSAFWGTRSCVFPFTVSDVPAGHAFYGVEVSHRGRLQYDSTRIKQPLTVTLGD